MKFHIVYKDRDDQSQEMDIEAETREEAIIAFHGEEPGAQQIVRMTDPWGTFQGG